MAAADTTPTAVLDASALMALMHGENGAGVVAEAIEQVAAISVANWAEVLSKLSEQGKNPEQAAADLHATHITEHGLTIEPVTEEDCIVIARLRPTTKKLGLSLADRACLALAQRLKVPVLTTDGAWEKLGAPAKVTLIR